MEGRLRERRIRVLVADGTRMHTELIAESLTRNPILDVFSVTGSGPHGVVEGAFHHKIDVAVIGCRLDDGPLGGLEVLRSIQNRRPEVRGIILLDSEKPEIILAAFKAGARGLFSRDAALDTLADCVCRVHAGEVCANSRQMAIALENLASSVNTLTADTTRLNLLSKRELDVVQSLAEGLSNREIAARLGLSQHTVKNYLFKVFDKLGVSSRTELLFLTLNHRSAAAPGKDSTGHTSHKGSDFASCLRAAQKGAPSAQLAVANMYAEGAGVRRDQLLAYMWYLISERTVLAMKDLIGAEKRKMASLLTTEEILDAQKSALEHQKKPTQGAEPTATLAAKSG